ncbi:hypothetical protein [Actinoplanes subtropicus]|uniref:hypothetical protein n=1 Tax=Actinoplanes subtropicus TaxID=543632 RepID=UPI0004C3F1D7|nr:hypothetical protein [Actinoplanes subtropicus]
MSGPRDSRPGGRRASRPNSTGSAGRLAGLYGYEHYEVTGNDGTVWSVSRRSPVRFEGTYEPTGELSEQDWRQAREEYQRQQAQRLDRKAEQLFQTHPDLIEHDDPDDTSGDTEHDS